MRPSRSLLLTIALTIASPLAPVVAGAQVTAGDARRSFSTRQELAEAAAQAQSAGRTIEAAMLRTRLTEGDFREGDRILFTLQGAAGTIPGGDTLIVRAGKVIQLPQMDDFQLAGVLRSELVPKLTAHLARYIRDPQIRAVPLVRLGVLGSVRAPGFYYLPADIPLSDILMRAGGPGPNTDLGKVVVRRDDKVVLERKAARVALADGLSADRLHLETGDQIVVGEKRRIGWQAITTTAIASTGLLIGVVRAAGSGEKKVAEPTCP